MSNFPKDGSTFVVEAIDRTAYRWAKYKPDGARQMKKPGRWQQQVWSGDYFTWENCEEPVGELSPPDADGPISAAFHSADAKDAEIERLRAAQANAGHLLELMHSYPNKVAKLTYTNWRGETAVRELVLLRLWFGSTEWHPEPQFMLTAYDWVKHERRDFAVADFVIPASSAALSKQEG